MKIEECKRLGADHYIKKPTNDIELDTIVYRVRTIFDLAALLRSD